jgi:lipooligosaccharide transport system ATP-binding protein
MADPVIRARHVFKSFGKLKALDDFSFSAEKGTCVGFLGPNGAGKTTMMKILYGKAVPDFSSETEIELFGFDPRQNQLAIKQLSGVVTQEDSLDEELNVIQNLRIYAKFYGMQQRRAEQRIEELLDLMELKEKKKAKIKQLSGGMKRRLVIARALLHAPSLLILDEPTTGLDPQVRHLIWDKLHELKKTGVSILLTTHYMNEAEQLSDRVIIMDKGRALMEGPCQRLLDEEIEALVVELKAKEHSAEIEALFRGGQVRKEEYADKILYYTSDRSLVEKSTRKLAPEEFLVRKPDLEDLFLKATGRHLNELQ